MPTSENADLTSQLNAINAAIVRNDARVHWYDIDIKRLKEDGAAVKQHADDIRALSEHIQTLAMRLKRIEEGLRITEPVEMAGD